MNMKKFIQTQIHISLLEKLKASKGMILQITIIQFCFIRQPLTTRKVHIFRNQNIVRINVTKKKCICFVVHFLLENCVCVCVCSQILRKRSRNTQTYV